MIKFFLQLKVVTNTLLNNIWYYIVIMMKTVNLMNILCNILFIFGLKIDKLYDNNEI